MNSNESTMTEAEYEEWSSRITRWSGPGSVKAMEDALSDVIGQERASDVLRGGSYLLNTGWGPSTIPPHLIGQAVRRGEYARTGERKW